MHPPNVPLTRRNALAGLAVAGTATMLPRSASADEAVSPFKVEVPDAALTSLRGRLRATRWPDRQTVSDNSQGVPRDRLHALIDYWANDYDWRKVEAKPTATGWSSNRIGRAWATLMERLGYRGYVSQGGDCGSVISQRMALQQVPGLLGMHLNMPATVPANIAEILAAGGHPPPGLPQSEREAFDALAAFYRDGSAYAAMMVTRPQTIGYALAGSPVGLAAWMYDKIAAWTFSVGEPERVLTKDEILDDISLYWLTETATSSARLYWEDHSNNVDAVRIASLPVAVSVFPGEIYRAPRRWAAACYGNLIYFNELTTGDHFAAWEQPRLFTTEVRAAFRSLR